MRTAYKPNLNALWIVSREAGRKRIKRRNSVLLSCAQVYSDFLCNTFFFLDFFSLGVLASADGDGDEGDASSEATDPTWDEPPDAEVRVD